MKTSCERTLTILADGRFHSGEAIARELGISRAAVWKHIQSLANYGLQVNAVTGKGYRLSQKIELLDETMFGSYLSDEARSWLQGASVKLVTGSTSDDARAGAEDNRANLYLAELQRHGRGRQGRVWAGGFAESICMSMVWRFEQTAASLSGLSLCVGLALVAALETLGIGDVQLKWPNDLFWRGRKLGGVLVELVGELAGRVTAVIGIGLNVDIKEAEQRIDQPWVDLTEICGHVVSRNELVAALVNSANQMLPQFCRQGFGFFIGDWQRVDMLQGQPVTISAGTQTWVGEAQGVQADGALLVRTEGQLKPLYGGDVSVRLSL